MKELYQLIIFLFLSVGVWSCDSEGIVHVSGRMENTDSIFSIWAGDSIYKFKVDESGFFFGKIKQDAPGYASILPSSLTLFLSPGEDLEIHGDAKNLSSSVMFKGSLGAINRYMIEQDVAEFFDQAFYQLEESKFIEKVNSLLEEKRQLLQAKNFPESFTSLENERIKYNIAERVSMYPFYRIKVLKEGGYRPGDNYTKLLSTFSINNDNLFKSLSYRRFLLNYVALQTGISSNDNESRKVVDYILSRVSSDDIRNFLLTETVVSHLRNNNGLNNSDYVLKVFWEQCDDKKHRDYISRLVKQWSRIKKGAQAPNFTLKDYNGDAKSLSDYQGSYVYVSVWATWCIPCKNELPYLSILADRYKEKNIKFLSVSIDQKDSIRKWREHITANEYFGDHVIFDGESRFLQDYMIMSVPRFILIDPQGRIIDSNAPRPSVIINHDIKFN